MKYKQGYKYILADSYEIKIQLKNYNIETPYITLSTEGNLVIREQYAWDGATMFPDFKVVIRGSLVHDALCQLIRLKHLPESVLPTVHKILSDIVEEDVKRFKTPQYSWVPYVMLTGLTLAGPLGKGYENKVITL